MDLAQLLILKKECEDALDAHCQDFDYEQDAYDRGETPNVETLSTLLASIKLLEHSKNEVVKLILAKIEVLNQHNS